MKYFKEDYDGAIEDFSKTLSHDKKNIEALIWRAKTYYFNDRNYDDILARIDLQTAMDLGSMEAKELILILFETGEPIDA